MSNPSELKKFLNSKKKETVNRLVSDIKAKINKAEDFAKDKSIQKCKNELLNERETLFCNTVDDVNVPYFYVKEFYDGYLSEVLGLENSFDNEFNQAKSNLLSKYQKHGYLPSIKLFLKQDDRDLVIKIGCYLGYEKVVNNFDSLIANRVKRKLDIDYEFKEMFVSQEICNKVQNIIDKHGIIVDNDWEGIYRGHKQEFPALVDVLIAHRYIEKGYPRIKVIERLINFYKLPLDYKSSIMRTIDGYAYMESKTLFENKFPKV